MRTICYFFIFLCGMGSALAGCNSKGSGGSDKATSATTANTIISSSGTSSLEVLDLENGTFTLPSDAVSFLLYEGQSNVDFSAILNPGGEDLSLAEPYSYFEYYDLGSGVLIPMEETYLATGGQWRLLHGSQENGFKLVLRTGKTPTNSILVIQPYLASSLYSTSVVEEALGVLKKIYENAGLQVKIEAMNLVQGSKFQTVSENFDDPTTSELISMGGSKTINLFFVDDLSGFGVLGITGGIPGSLGIAGNRNGVLNNLSAHMIDGELNVKLLGETAAHEMGHWLGLYHTTESNGREFDPLSDTPECRNTNPAFLFSTVSVSDCIDLDGENLMFWAGDTRFEQTTLSSGQARIINYSPIAR